MFLEVYRFNFEWTILEWINKIDSKLLDYFFYFIAQIGGSLGILIIMTFIYWCINKEKGVKVAFIGVVGINLNGILKGLFLAKRPFQYQDKAHLDRLAGTSLDSVATGTSFPSGHSQNSGTLYSSLIRYFKKNWVLIISIFMLIIVPFSILEALPNTPILLLTEILPKRSSLIKAIFSPATPDVAFFML